MNSHNAILLGIYDTKPEAGRHSGTIAPYVGSRIEAVRRVAAWSIELAGPLSGVEELVSGETTRLGSGDAWNGSQWLLKASPRYVRISVSTAAITPALVHLPSGTDRSFDAGRSSDGAIVPPFGNAEDPSTASQYW